MNLFIVSVVLRSNSVPEYGGEMQGSNLIGVWFTRFWALEGHLMRDSVFPSVVLFWFARLVHLHPFHIDFEVLFSDF